MAIGPSVLEKKIFEGLLPYMGVAAILVMVRRYRKKKKKQKKKKKKKKNFNATIQGGSTLNFNWIGQVLSEMKIFELVDDDNGR